MTVEVTNVKPVAGTKLFVKALVGDEYTEVGEIVDMGEYGPTYEEIMHKPIGTFTTFKFTGARDNGQLPLQLGQDLEDAGQEILRTRNGLTAYFKIEFPDAEETSGATPTTDEFAGTILSFKTKIGNVSGIIGASSTISISGDITRTPKSS